MKFLKNKFTLYILPLLLAVGTLFADTTDLRNLAATVGSTSGTRIQVKDALIETADQIDLTNDNFDAANLTGWLQGDLYYASANDTPAKLPKNTSATRYLSNTGASNNPAWAQVNLANGVTGDLPYANLTQSAGLSVLGVAGSSTADVAAMVAGSDHNVLRRSGSAVSFGSINLASTNAVTGTLPSANGGTGGNFTFANGTYTPSGTNTANMGTLGFYAANYLRVGNQVTVSGKVDVDATTTATGTGFRFTLPIASNLTNDQNLAGWIGAFSPMESGIIRAESTNDQAQVEVIVQTAANHAMFYHFTYTVQ